MHFGVNRHLISENLEVDDPARREKERVEASSYLSVRRRLYFGTPNPSVVLVNSTRYGFRPFVRVRERCHLLHLITIKCTSNKVHGEKQANCAAAVPVVSHTHYVPVVSFDGENVPEPLP